MGISGNGRVILDSDGSVIISLAADVKRVRKEVSTLGNKFSCGNYYLSNLYLIQRNLPLF